MEPAKQVRDKPGTVLPAILATTFVAVGTVAATWRDLRMAGSLAIVAALITDVWILDDTIVRRRLARAAERQDELLYACDELDAVIVRVDLDSPARHLAWMARQSISLSYCPDPWTWRVYVGGTCLAEASLPYVALEEAIKTYDKENAREFQGLRTDRTPGRPATY